MDRVHPSPTPDPRDDYLGMAAHHPGPRVTVLRVTGELDTLTSGLLEQRAMQLLGERPDLILDLTKVTFLGSSGLRVLMSTHALAETHHGQLSVVTGGHRVVVRAITLTALDRVLRLYPDLDTALAALPTS